MAFRVENRSKTRKACLSLDAELRWDDRKPLVREDVHELDQRADADLALLLVELLDHAQERIERVAVQLDLEVGSKGQKGVYPRGEDLLLVLRPPIHDDTLLSQLRGRKFDQPALDVFFPNILIQPHDNNRIRPMRRRGRVRRRGRPSLPPRSRSGGAPFDITSRGAGSSRDVAPLVDVEVAGGKRKTNRLLLGVQRLGLELAVDLELVQLVERADDRAGLEVLRRDPLDIVLNARVDGVELRALVVLEAALVVVEEDDVGVVPRRAEPTADAGTGDGALGEKRK